MLQLLSSLAKRRKLMLESFQVHQSEERVLNSNESGADGVAVRLLWKIFRF